MKTTALRKKRTSLRSVLKSDGDLYLLMLPAIVLVLIFGYIPILSGLTMAFQEFDIMDGFFGSPWVGLAQFDRVFTDSNFYLVLWNSFIISVMKLVITFPLPILLAILIDQLRNILFKRTIQTLIYLPHFLSWSIVYGIFLAILGYDGPVNQFLALFGLEKIPFFVTPSVFRGVLVTSEAWKEVGWGTIIYLSALTAIDPGLYDAAKIDGASKINQILHVTLPELVPTIMVMLVLRLGGLLSAGFEQILIMYNPSVYDVADVIDTYVYRSGIGQLEFSYGAAVGLFNSVVSFALVITSNLIAKKKFGRSIW